jgi:hypothetical protein
MTPMSNTNPRTELATIHEVTAIDQQQMQALADQLLPKWPKDLNRQTALDVARVALAYQLDPFMEELIPYQGKPYVTIAGRIRIADNHPMFDGYDLEPATDAEHRALGAHEGEAVWKCVVYRKDRSRPTKAFGRAGGPAETNPVARRWLPEIAQKRAMHRALRAAFPLNLPGVEERSSAAQLRAIHAVDAEYGIDREARHQALAETYGVESSDELTSAQAGAYLDERVVEQHVEIDVDGEVIEVLEDELGEGAFEQEYRSILTALGKVSDRRDLSTLKARIRAAGLESDEEVQGAYSAAYNRLRGAQATNDAQAALQGVS